MTASPQLSTRNSHIDKQGAACVGMKPVAAPTILTASDFPTSTATLAAAGRRTSMSRRIEVALAALLYRMRIMPTPRARQRQRTYPPLHTIFESSRLERESHRL